MEFFHPIIQAIIDRRAEVAALPEWVKTWVAFMRILFFSGIVFVPWWKAPRYVIVTMIASAIAIIAGKLLIPEFDTVMVGTMSQLVLWTPLLIYLIYNWRVDSLPALKSRSVFSKVYGVWMVVVIGTVCISQAFNLVGFAKFILVNFV